MNDRRVLSLAFSFTLCAIALAVLLVLASNPARAQSPTRYVAPGGACGGASPCYVTIQAAVDAASDGDTIKVAQGTYTGSGFQVVYISEAITVTGGYTITDWDYPLPWQHPTIIDAESTVRRRGVYISRIAQGIIKLDGLHIKRGNSSDSDGGGVYILTGTVTIEDSAVRDSGVGGIYMADGTLVLLRDVVEGNFGYEGGGLYIAGGRVTITDSEFKGNRGREGGGLYAFRGTLTVTNSDFTSNGSSSFGGGLVLGAARVSISGSRFYSNNNSAIVKYPWGPVQLSLDGNVFKSNQGTWGGAVGICTSVANIITMTDNIFLTNHARGTTGLGPEWEGGGAVAIYSCGGYSSAITLRSNLFQGNTAAGSGGALYIGSQRMNDEIHILENLFLDNKAEAGGFGGGAILIDRSTGVSLDGNTIIGNRATSRDGGGILIHESDVAARNDVIANNASAWSGVYVFGEVYDSSLSAHHWTLADNGDYALIVSNGTASLQNTIVASHTVGGLVGSGILADYTLFFNSGAPCSSGASCTHNRFGDPEFLNPTVGDYHLGPWSAAVDQGMDAGVMTDIETLALCVWGSTWEQTSKASCRLHHLHRQVQTGSGRLPSSQTRPTRLGLLPILGTSGMEQQATL